MDAGIFECVYTRERDSFRKFDRPATSNMYLNTFEVELCTSQSVLAPHCVTFMQGNKLRAEEVVSGSQIIWDGNVQLAFSVDQVISRAPLVISVLTLVP